MNVCVCLLCGRVCVFVCVCVCVCVGGGGLFFRFRRSCSRQHPFFKSPVAGHDTQHALLLLRVWIFSPGCTLDKPMFRRCRLRGWKLRHCSLVDLESDEVTDLFGSACFEGCHFVNVCMSCSPLNGLEFTGCTFDSCSFAEVKSTKLTLQGCCCCCCLPSCSWN